MNHELEAKAVGIAQAFIDRANGIYGRNFCLPKITWDIRSKTVAGRAHLKEWRISLNSGFVNESHLWDDTIGHEIAHLVTKQIYPNYIQHHGPEWKAVMRRLGLEAKRCHNMQRLGKSFSYKCPTCAQIFSVSPIIHKKIGSGRLRYCRKPFCRINHKPIILSDIQQTSTY
jgi:predicted SprT family Zn-dependent metalloprotease